MATRNGLEPSTSSVTGWRSNQLNYRAMGHFLIVLFILWWGEVDSNHRRETRQIYSLLPLAARQPPQDIKFLWSWRLESNPQPADYKSAALPVELRQHILNFNGASGRNRTTDTGIFSPLLYRLSYRGKKMAT